MCFWFEINSWIHIEISFLWEEKQIFYSFNSEARLWLIDLWAFPTKTKWNAIALIIHINYLLFFFFWLKLIKKTWSLIVKCRSSCSWNQIKTVCSVNRRYFVFQLASGIAFKHLDLVAKFLGSKSSNVVQRVHSYYKFLKFRWVSKI